MTTKITSRMTNKKELNTTMRTSMFAAALSVAALVSTGFAPVQAQTPIEFTSITGGGTPPTFIYTGGPGGGLTLTPGNFDASLDVPVVGTQVSNPATVLFTGLSNVGSTSTAMLGGRTLFDQALSGGGFSILDGSQVLLSGTFTGAQLTGTEGSTLANVATNFEGVSYTGGLYASDSNIILNGTPVDTFNFQLINSKPSLTVTNGVLNSFKSAGSGQFTGTQAAPAVPEPATVVPFLFGGLGLLALAVRKARKAASPTASSSAG